MKGYDVTDFRALWNDADDRFTIIGYVKNAFDQGGFTSNGFDHADRDFRQSEPRHDLDRADPDGDHARPDPARTYGVELQYRF